MSLQTIRVFVLTFFIISSFATAEHAAESAGGQAEAEGHSLAVTEVKDFNDYKKQLELAKKKGSSAVLSIFSMDGCPGCIKLKKTAKTLGKDFPEMTVLSIKLNQEDVTDEWAKLLDEYWADGIAAKKTWIEGELAKLTEALTTEKDETKIEEIKGQIELGNQQLERFSSKKGSTEGERPYSMLLYPNDKGWSYKAYSQYMPLPGAPKREALKSAIDQLMEMAKNDKK